jgi:DNA repair ATPase RecN
MKKFKNLNACIADLKALCAGSDVRPEQKRHVEAAIEQLRRLRRKPRAKAVEVHRCVREVASRLIMAFSK